MVTFDETLHVLIERGFIAKSQSNYNSLCFLRPNQNGKHNLIVDFTEINKLTSTLQCHFPDLKDQLHRLTKSNWSTKIDLEQGSYQVNIRTSYRQYIAFSTSRGKFEFKRLAFALKNAPNFFQQMMIQILSDIPNVAVFVDDIIIYNENKLEHIRTIEQVLARLGEYNVKIKKDKSSFCENTVTYLGHVMRDGRYIFDKSRHKDSKLWKKPITKRQVQSLLGTLNWYRPYIKDLSTRVSFLYDLVKKRSRNKINLVKTNGKPSKIFTMIWLIKLNFFSRI